MLTDQALESLRKKLEECHEWPCRYMFKFIVPQEQSHQLCAVLDMMPACERASSSGKYVSITIEEKMSSPDEVVMIYQKASTVPGVLAL
ncbi:DUF493 domain-containing protein [Oceanidesulfovibrio indonesiensis]|uniref:DUF493 domain-containing protein n=1 Tax=Oceanidesulfovibrio indonesiensis TaxID=54767 RepID=A0A7M3MFT7_9BACT|nr:DUF493 family protein [Oceanidesulfovibrio indonesiensis]TVM17974.1 DUF493 domain-containing protein [Oceanidesulfovibrio indonesiensis]